MSRVILVELPNIKFHDMLLNGFDITGGETGNDRDVTKLIGTFCNFSLEKCQSQYLSV
jgi:hypothetical protein